MLFLVTALKFLNSSSQHIMPFKKNEDGLDFLLNKIVYTTELTAFS